MLPHLAEQAAPPSSPHYKNSQAETGTDKQLAQADTNRVAEHEVLNAKKSAEKAQTVVQEATIEVAQEEQAIKNVKFPISFRLLQPIEYFIIRFLFLS